MSSGSLVFSLYNDPSGSINNVSFGAEIWNDNLDRSRRLGRSAPETPALAGEEFAENLVERGSR